MKIVSMGEEQHDQQRIFCSIQAREIVMMTKRNYPVAQLRPTSHETAVKRPHFQARLLKTFHQELNHPSNAALIVTERGDR
jgi:hypothetical protein